MRRLRRTLLLLLLLGAAALGALLLYGWARSHPEDLPWTGLDLTRPIGAFTGRKLAGLADEGGRCKALLSEAGVAFEQLPPRDDGPNCGYRHAVRLTGGGSREIGWRPLGLGTNCAVAAGLALWEWHVVQPAAQRHFGSAVETIEHLGSYSCRRMAGGERAAWSEHAEANAVDVAGFRLEDGTRIRIAEDWETGGPKAAFLRDVRDGACRLFATVLSPDYNRAHADHLHLDQAERGAAGWRACR